MSTLSKIFEEIRSMADQIHLPRNIVDRTKKLFKKVHAEKILKGYSHSGIASACLYISCRQKGAARSTKEIHAVSNSSIKEIKKCFQLISKVLKTSVGSITSTNLISRFCSTLGLPMAVDKAATHIAQRAVELDIVPGRSPMSVAAAAIYMASQASKDMVKKTPKEIGAVAGVVGATIRESYKLMRSRAYDLFPEDFAFTFPISYLPDL